MSAPYNYLCCFLIAAVTACAAVQVRAQDAKAETMLPLMPYPRQLSTADGRLAIGAEFSAAFSGYRSARMQQAIRRFYRRIENQTGIFLQRKNQQVPAALTIHIAQAPINEFPQLNDDESYSLAIDKQRITIDAASPYGAMRALETLLQLIALDKQGRAYVPAMNIIDSPRFKWRGVMLDSARHFISVQAIKRQLDGMASAKYNVFHWHLTDDQGWRIESKKFPKLHELGSDGQYYSQEDVKSIVEHARQLGIRVVPEFNFPGHVSAIALAYPELMSAKINYRKQIHWGVHEPTMNPADPRVYRFIDTLIGEMKALFPDEYVHIGGDEVNPKHWNDNKNIQKFMARHSLADHRQLQAYFNKKLNSILRSHGRKMVGWDEILHPDLPKSVVVHSWRGPDSLAEAASQGYAGILSAGYYIDQPQPASYHYRAHPVETVRRTDERVSANETMRAWQFTMPRKKGSAVTGRFTLIYNEDKKARGFIDFTGKARRALSDVQLTSDSIRFWLDTWMGKTQFELLHESGRVQGVAVVANAGYRINGTELSSDGIRSPAGASWPKTLDDKQQSLVLGGEATLWTELVSENNIDLRIWPRAYAIAERLWSSKEVDDEQSMYQRLQRISDWSIASVGLQHEWQSRQAMKRLSGGRDIRPLQTLSESVEQAQYYHRHHEKYLREQYHQFALLNRFADALPAESMPIRTLNELVAYLLLAPDNESYLTEIADIFLRWRENHKQVMPLIEHSGLLDGMDSIAKKSYGVANVGLMCVEAIRLKKTLQSKQSKLARKILNSAKTIDQELVVASAYPVEKLLSLCL